MADTTQPMNSIRKVRKAVLPAAGLGTRFLPATKAQPKEMLTVVDKPQIQYVVEECVASGIEHIIIVTGKGKNSIEDHFDHAPTLERFLEEKGKKDQAAMVRRISDMVQVSYTRQKEPLGLGHAVLVAKDLVGDEPFAVLLGDVLIPGENPATKQLIEVYAATGVGAIAVEEVPREKTHLYGIVDGGRSAGSIRCAALEDSRPRGKAETGEGSIQPGDHRPLCFAAADFRLPGAHQTRSRE
jgi:UTP--glucose-1-phosphate uridylyltransferase